MSDPISNVLSSRRASSEAIRTRWTTAPTDQVGG